MITYEYDMSSDERRIKTKKYLLPYEGKFYKANLHCHSTVTDGKLSPEEIKEIYMQKGYSVVAYTDHNVFIDRQDLTDENFVALNGVESNTPAPGTKIDRTSKVCHFCAIAKDKANLVLPCYHRSKYFHVGNAESYRGMVQFDENEPDYERYHCVACVNDMMQRFKSAGFFVTYNHPGWSMERYPDYIQYYYMDAIEMYNGSCIHMGYADYNSREYDDFLLNGKKIFCIGADDNHNRYPVDNAYCDSFHAFTMIKAKSLTYEGIIEAMEKGDFYASQGPEIYELYYEDNKVYIKTSDCERITMSADGRKNRTVINEGNGLTEAVFEVREDDKYIRFTIMDKYGKTASSNAYFLEDILK